MCFDRNINGNKDVKFLESDCLPCVMVRETHFRKRKEKIVEFQTFNFIIITYDCSSNT